MLDGGENCVDCTNSNKVEYEEVWCILARVEDSNNSNRFASKGIIKIQNKCRNYADWYSTAEKRGK